MYLASATAIYYNRFLPAESWFNVKHIATPLTAIMEYQGEMEDLYKFKQENESTIYLVADNFALIPNESYWFFRLTDKYYFYVGNKAGQYLFQCIMEQEEMKWWDRADSEVFPEMACPLVRGDYIADHLITPDKVKTTYSFIDINDSEQISKEIEAKIINHLLRTNEQQHLRIRTRAGFI